jgi:hypothetical protein
VSRSCLLGLIALAALGSAASGEEFFIGSDSTVLGRNHGYPYGTPSQEPTRVGEIDLVLEAAPFFKNLELSGLDPADNSAGAEVDGETFFGFLLPLRLRYRAHERVTFELGAVVGQDFGDEDELDIAEPLARLGWEPWDDFFLVMGTIFPTHWIHDALLDDVQKLRTNAEQGFQARVDRRRWQQDTWINWRVRETGTDPEEFEVGSASRLLLLDRTLWLDLQLMYAHVGGQVSTSPRVEDNVAGLAGASYGWRAPLGLRAVDEVRVGAHYLFAHDEGRGLPDLDGDGYEVRAALDAHPLERLLVRVNGSWFSGSDLLAERGDPLYWFPDYGQLGLSAVWILPAGLRIEAGVVGQWNEGTFNNTYLLAFTWGQGFRLDFLEPRRGSADEGARGTR